MLLNEKVQIVVHSWVEVAGCVVERGLLCLLGDGVVDFIGDGRILFVRATALTASGGSVWKVGVVLLGMGGGRSWNGLGE